MGTGLFSRISRKKVPRSPGSNGASTATVQFSAAGSGENQAFAMLREVVEEMASKGAAVFLSGLKNQLRKKDSSFTEKKFGYAGFLQFCKAAATKGLIELTWDEEAGEAHARGEPAGA